VGVTNSGEGAVDINHMLRTVGLDSIKEAVEADQTTGLMLRSQAFLGFIAELLHRFQQSPKLKAVKLVAVVTTEVFREQDVCIVFRHHYKLVLEGDQGAFGSESDRGDLLSRYLPHSLMGQGVFELRRQNRYVQRFFGINDEDHTEYMSILQGLAYEFHAAICPVETRHFVGSD
jgi:hypothetical protein